MAVRCSLCARAVVSRWTFREFNELPHFYERRMSPSYEAAEAYLKLFTQSTLVTTLGQLLVLVGGSLGAILVVFAALNDAILLHVKISDWNLLWYFGVLGVVYTGGKALQPSAELRPRYIRNIFEEMSSALDQVATFTHFYPEVWKARAWDRGTYKAVSALFQYKAKLFVHEVVSVILAPIVLCVSLPKCAENICEFVVSIKAEVPGAGEVCGYSTFNFDVFGDETWEGRTLGVGSANEGEQYGVNSDMTGSFTASVMRTKNVDTATKMHPRPKATHGKMEKSFFDFKANHPDWRCTESGQTLLDRVETYKTEETKALARERQLHIEAAAHQLEVLKQLEQRRQVESQGNHGTDANISHFARAAGGADSGGGFVPEEPPLAVPELTTRLGADQQLSSNQYREVASSASRSSIQPSVQDGTLRGISSSTSLGVPHYADVGLSRELRTMLGHSSFDPGLSAMSSAMGDASFLAAGGQDDVRERSSETQVRASRL
jgi:hypothetical protein